MKTYIMIKFHSHSNNLHYDKILCHGDNFYYNSVAITRIKLESYALILLNKTITYILLILHTCELHKCIRFYSRNQGGDTPISF